MLSFGKLQKLSFLLLSIFLSSCLELEEKIVLHSDKSGEYSLVLRGLAGLQTNQAFAENVKEGIQLFMNKAQNVKGITSIKEINNRNEFGISFTFEHPRAFRQLMAEMTNISSFFIPSYFSFSRHKFSKKNITPVFQKAIQADSTVQNILSRVSFLPLGSLLTWKIIVVTPYDIKKVKQNPYVHVDGKTATLRLSLEQILQNTSSGFVLRLR